MVGFKKGNKFTFKTGNIPHNKKRTNVKQLQNDSKTPEYIRLTKRMHQLVVNDPYTPPEEKAKRSVRAAKLLRPKSDTVPVPKKVSKPAVKDER